MSPAQITRNLKSLRSREPPPPAYLTAPSSFNRLQLPIRPNPMTSVPRRIFLQIILMIFFSDPKRTGCHNLRHDRRRPDMRSRQLRNQAPGHLFLPLIQVKNGRPVRQPNIVTLPVARRRIMDLKEKFQQLTIRQQTRIKNHLDALCMRTMIAISGIRHITAGIPDRRRNNTGKSADQLFHPPKTTSRQNSFFCSHHTKFIQSGENSAGFFRDLTQSRHQAVQFRRRSKNIRGNPTTLHRSSRHIDRYRIDLILT
jgi:hypothetical protein